MLFLTNIEEIWGSKLQFVKIFFFVFEENVYLCNVLYCRYVKVAGKKRRTLHNVKASSMLCQLASLNLRNSNCVSVALSEVNATGMEQLYPGVCSEG